MERVVGVTLIFLAGYLFFAIFQYFRAGEEFRMRSRWMVVFAGIRNSFDALGARAVYPAYHVVAGLTRASGARIVACSGAEAGGICSFAYRGQGATLVWLANQTAHEKTVRVAAGPGRNSSAAFGIVLDENSFERATLDPFTFQAGHRALDLARLPLGPYAVALACIPDA